MCSNVNAFYQEPSYLARGSPLHLLAHLSSWLWPQTTFSCLDMGLCCEGSLTFFSLDHVVNSDRTVSCFQMTALSDCCSPRLHAREQF